MSQQHPFDGAVYKAGGHMLSIRDLLSSFIDPEHKINGISRISDVHIKIDQPVRYRYDGSLETVPEGTMVNEESFKGLVYPMLSEDQIKRFEGSRTTDIDAGYDWPEEEQSFRLNIFRDRHGPAAVIRLLPRFIPKVEEVGFPSHHTWAEIINMQQGLVLVTGITGSGKTTTIASLIKKINETRKVRIITLEDPIEYFLDSEEALISQRQLGQHIESFHGGLRSALREDPDMIFVGEMRDRETAQLAISAAETGHMVLSTLHTKDTRSAVSRIIDMFPVERTKEVGSQLSFSLTYVIGQKLIPRADGNGRCVAMEVLRNVGSVANLIRQGKTHQIYSVMETQSKLGMNTLEQRLTELAKSGVITVDEALAHGNDVNSMSELTNMKK